MSQLENAPQSVEDLFKELDIACQDLGMNVHDLENVRSMFVMFKDAGDDHLKDTATLGAKLATSTIEEINGSVQRLLKALKAYISAD